MVQKKNQSGEIMIESILVMIPTLFVLGFLIALGTIYYQHWSVQIAANETASKMAELYSYQNVPIKTGVTSYETVDKQNPYRNTDMFGLACLEYAAKYQGEEYAEKYLSLVSFAKCPDLSVDVEMQEDSFANRHLYVTIEGTFQMPFGVFLEAVTMPSEYTFQAEGYAVCTDLSDYLSCVNYVKNIKSLSHMSEIGVISDLDKVLKMVKKVRDCWTTLTDDSGETHEGGGHSW